MLLLQDRPDAAVSRCRKPVLRDWTSDSSSGSQEQTLSNSFYFRCVTLDLVTDNNLKPLNVWKQWE